MVMLEVVLVKWSILEKCPEIPYEFSDSVGPSPEGVSPGAPELIAHAPAVVHPRLLINIEAVLAS